MSIENSNIEDKTLFKKYFKKISFIITILLVTVLLFSNYSYVIYSPGPTLNTLGKIDENTYLIEIENKKRQDLPGQLHLTTVSQQGGPDRYVSGISLILAWFDDEKEIEKAEQVYPKNVTREQIDNFNKTQMSISQQNAVVAALNELGKPPFTTMKISEVDKSSSFYGKAEKNDKILQLQTPKKVVQAQNSKEFYDLLSKTKVNSYIKMTVERKGKILELEGKTIPPAENGLNGNRGSRLGIVIESNYDFDEKIKFALKDIGGPSAGLIFSLSIMNLLSEKQFLGDNIIAGTGTISPNGYVGPIGGIRFKLLGAKSKNIKWFIMPKENCDEVLENPVNDITAIPVDTLSQAQKVIESINKGETNNLPKCE